MPPLPVWFRRDGNRILSVSWADETLGLRARHARTHPFHHGDGDGPGGGRRDSRAAGPAVRAQPNPQSPPVPANPAQQQQARRFVATFRNDVVSGCLTQPPQLRNPRGYCTCYADAFVNRFTADDLLSIERAAQVQGVDNVIALMMAPEIRACRLAN